MFAFDIRAWLRFFGALFALLLGASLPTQAQPNLPGRIEMHVVSSTTVATKSLT